MSAHGLMDDNRTPDDNGIAGTADSSTKRVAHSARQVPGQWMTQPHYGLPRRVGCELFFMEGYPKRKHVCAVTRGINRNNDTNKHNHTNAVTQDLAVRWAKVVSEDF